MGLKTMSDLRVRESYPSSPLFNPPQQNPESLTHDYGPNTQNRLLPQHLLRRAIIAQVSPATVTLGRRSSCPLRAGSCSPNLRRLNLAIQQSCRSEKLATGLILCAPGRGEMINILVDHWHSFCFYLHIKGC